MFPESIDGDPQYRRPLWFAGLATTLAGPILYLLCLATYVLATRGSLAGGEFSIGVVFALVLVGLPVSAFSMFVIGMPLVLVLRNAGMLTLPLVSVAGAVAGAAGMCGLIAVFKSPPDSEVIALGAAIGALAGCVFSGVAGIRIRRLRREDLAR